MYQFVWERSFIRSYKKVIKNNIQLKDRIDSTLSIMYEDPFAQKLKTHKLHGDLQPLLASSINFEYRIVFSIKVINGVNSIILIDIGTHDEVY